MRHRTLPALVWLGASCAGLLVLPAPAHAQHPLCPAPAAGDTYYFSCRPGTGQRVASFLYDFSVRHLLKSPETFEIPTEDFLDVLDVGKFLVPRGADREALLKDRPTIEFRPLDGTTGEFTSKGPKEPQTFKATEPKTGITVETTVPEVVQGLYWRSPAHLELQFYKGHGIRFRLAGNDVPEYKEGLQCISITPSRARATTGDLTHRYLMNLFESCP